MSVISSLMLLQSDPQTEAGLQFGFEREGVRVRRPKGGESVEDALEDDLQLVVVGGSDRADALTQLNRVRGALGARDSHLPVLYVGNGASRAEALESGASEVIESPAYVRDVITVARFLCSPVKQINSALTGELSDHFGLFYVVRALAAVRRQGVLTLIRGLRRGELRFYDGEVTSAQVGFMHGLAALHQLLLWTDARFELRAENVVRRQQIPLSRAELISNSEKFLGDIREVAEGMSPSAVYQPSTERIAEAAASAPIEVLAVLKLFDGTRTVADVIEDSQFRVFETLRIANRLKDFGAIEKTALEKPRSGARAALAIEEWLVDSGPAPRSVLTSASEALGPAPGEPASPPKRKKKKKKKKKRERESSAAQSSPVKFDWTSLIPDRPSGLADGDGFSQVVPSGTASGEIGIATLGEKSKSTASDDDPTDPITPPAREKLEDVADKQKLKALFPSEENKTAEEPEPEPEPRAKDEAAAGKKEWQGDTEPLSEVDLDEVGDDSDSVPRPVAQTASGEIKLPEMPQFLRARPDAGAAVVIDRTGETDDTDPVPRPSDTDLKTEQESIADDGTTEAESEQHPDFESSDQLEDEVDFEDVQSGIIDTGDAPSADIGKAAIEEASLNSVELSGGETTSGEISSDPTSTPTTSEARTTASGEISAKSVEVEPSAVEEPSRRRRSSTSPPALAAKASTTARDAAAAIHAAVRHRTPTEPGRAPSESEATSRLEDVRDRGATKDAAEVARSAARVADDVAEFSAEDQAFFSAGAKLADQSVPPPEDFDDLDEAYDVPKTFWQRLMSKPDEAPQSKKRGRKK